MLSCLGKEFLYSFCTDADKHFIKVRAGAKYEIATGFSSNCASQQSLTSPGLTEKHHSFEKLCALLLVQLRVLYYANNVNDLVFNLVDSFYVVQSLLY